MKTGYYINDKFILDDGTPAGVNVMLFNGDNLDYWFDEKRFLTVAEANQYIAGMIEVVVDHPIANRKYSPEELIMFDMTEDEVANL